MLDVPFMKMKEIERDSSKLVMLAMPSMLWTDLATNVELFQIFLSPNLTPEDDLQE